MSNYCQWILAVAVGVIVGDALKEVPQFWLIPKSIQMDWTL